MTKQEWLRLRDYWTAHLNRPRMNNNQGGRNLIKGRGRGVGAVLKTSFVKCQSHPERVFINR